MTTSPTRTISPTVLDAFVLNTWTDTDYAELLTLLDTLSDAPYAAFTTKGTRSQYPIIGVRLPLLRTIAKTISKGNYRAFLALVQPTSFELVMLRGFVIANIRDFDEFMEYFWSQVELIDDWSLCDSFCNSLRLARRHPSNFLPIIDTLIRTSDEFKVRIGLVILLAHFVATPYLPTIFAYLDQIDSDAYYINMAEAWLLCEIIVKFPEAGLAYLQHHHLNRFTLRKTISKVHDSYRVSPKLKTFLKTTYL